MKKADKRSGVDRRKVIIQDISVSKVVVNEEKSHAEKKIR